MFPSLVSYRNTRKLSTFLFIAVVILVVLSTGTAAAAAVIPGGGEFRVNTYTTNNQDFYYGVNAVAAAADGNFVVTWDSEGQDGSGSGVYAQRFSAAGVPQGEEFRVNTHITNSQHSASIAMNADGDFVITWTSSGQDGSGAGVYGQRYASDGTARGGEFRVNTYTINGQYASSVAMDDAGNFVITWTSFGEHSGSVWYLCPTLQRGGRESR